MVTEMTDKVCPLLKAANRTFLECVQNQCAWYVDGACALNTLARNLHGVASCKQVTEALCHNGSGGFDESLATKKQATSEWISVKDRLPTREDAPTLSVLAISKRDGFACEWSYDAVALYPGEYTYWMPMPEPPEVET